MRGATLQAQLVKDGVLISIHAPHAGRDSGRFSFYVWFFGISIHAPHAGRDSNGPKQADWGQNFNPRAPCGARLSFHGLLGQLSTFQSTRPMRGATVPTDDSTVAGVFQSTRPMRGATICLFMVIINEHISIHAPHAGRDQQARP